MISPLLQRLGRAIGRARDPLIVCVLGLTALSPLVKSTLPRSFDGLFHLFRLLEIEHLVTQGVPFARWAPDFLYGYGLPVFNFVPHLPYYLAAIPRLVGLDLVHTLLVSFGLSLIASGLAMYVFVKDVFGARAALVAAVAYMYAPFHLYDLLFRGHLPGSWALVLYPLVLWSFRRLALSGRTRYLMLSSTLYAASFLSHNPAHLIFTPFLLFYLAVLLAVAATHRMAAASRVCVALLLGAGLAAFFWIPALLDRQYIQLDRMVSAPELDYRAHFITAGELLAPPPTAYTGLMNPGVPNSLGPVLIALSVLSPLALLRLSGREERVHVIIFLCGLAGVVFMVSPFSAPVWDRMPFLEYLVFPHRILRLGILVMAVLCGLVTRLWPDRKSAFSPAFSVTLISVSLIVFSTIPALYPPYYDSLPLNPSFVDMMEFERSTGTAGTTSFGEYLPVWVEWVPNSSPLEVMYADSTTIERIDEASLPEGTILDSVQYGPLSATIHLRLGHPAQLTYRGLYFPGWRAYVDGKSTPLAPTPGLGLISLAVPAGEHLVEIRFERTTTRSLAESVSLLSLLSLATLGVFSTARVRGVKHVRWLASPARPAERRSAPSPLIGRQTTALVAASVALVLFKVAFVDRTQSPFKRDFDGVHIHEAQYPIEVNFGDLISPDAGRLIFVQVLVNESDLEPVAGRGSHA